MLYLMAFSQSRVVKAFLNTSMNDFDSKHPPEKRKQAN